MHESGSSCNREEVCLPDEGKGVVVPGSITEEEKYMEQKVVFVAYQVQNLKLFFYLFISVFNFRTDQVVGR